MYAMGIDLHKVSLGALVVSLGMLVDDAIVVVELMEVKMSEGMERKEASFLRLQNLRLATARRNDHHLSEAPCPSLSPIRSTQNIAAAFSQS